MKLKGTKEDFKRFVNVQKSGVVNMLDKLVQTLAGITKEVHYDIISNYDEYEKEYKK